MTGLDTILESIRKDGRENADAILAKARQEADEISAQGREEAQLRREELLRDAPQQAQDAADRVLSSAHREQRRILLVARQEIIQETLEAAEKSLFELTDEDYFTVLLGLAAKRALPQKGELVLGSRDFARKPADFEKKLQTVLPKGAELTVASKPNPAIDGGFLLLYGGIEENCTFRALFDDKREELQDLTNQILFAD